MWAPTSLIIRLVSVGCRDTFFFFFLHSDSSQMYCFDLFSFIKHLRGWPCSKSKVPKGRSLVWNPLVSCQPVPPLNNMASLAARLSSQLQPFSHVASFWWCGVSQFIDIEGGSLLWSIFAGALDARGLKGINRGAKSPVSIALADSPCLTHFLVVHWSQAWSPFRLPS